MNQSVLLEIRSDIIKSGYSPKLWLEKNLKLSEVLALRQFISIQENAEPLAAIDPEAFRLIDPHPYLDVGAPYQQTSPFCLRTDLVIRLSNAQKLLSTRMQEYQLFIFDGYRPRSVQIYMRNFEFRRFAAELGFDPESPSDEQRAHAWEKVNALWAEPSSNSQPPSPHSTGAAIDLTIIDGDGVPLEMGSEFDESSPRIHPNYYQDNQDLAAQRININRELLRSVMEEAGFSRLSHEWWHFSRGDQYWALIESLTNSELISAFYGEIKVS